jgi:uncharacterized protein (TIGR03086 family)
MTSDPLNLYRRASEWTLSKVSGSVDKLDAATPCDGWDVRTLMNHMLDTQQYFVARARGEDASRPSPQPPELVGDDGVAAFQRVRDDTLEVFAQEGVIARTGPSLGIAFSETLLHGWDLARATGQDSTMPQGLAEAAYEMIHGRFTEEQRQGVFKPEIPAGPTASPQEKLLVYTGRDPTA